MKILKTWTEGSRTFAEFVCDCGNNAIARLDHLKSGRTRSCGCVRRQATRERMTTHGDTGEPLWTIWTNVTRDSVCPEWGDYATFKADVGSPPDGKQLCRIDKGKPWSKDNVSWETTKYIHRHKPSNWVIEWDGKRMTSQDWAEIVGIQATTIRRRILTLGWSVQEALTIPAFVGRNGHTSEDFYKSIKHPDGYQPQPYKYREYEELPLPPTEL